MQFRNLIQEIKRMSLAVTNISELRWPRSGICNHDDGTLYYSGSNEEDKYHRYGIGIFVTSEFVRFVRSCVPINDRIMLLQLNTCPFNIHILQVYAPTAAKKDDNEVEMFYKQLDEILQTRV